MDPRASRRTVELSAELRERPHNSLVVQLDTSDGIGPPLLPVALLETARRTLRQFAEIRVVAEERIDELLRYRRLCGR